MTPRTLEEKVNAGEVSTAELMQAYLLEISDPFRGPQILRWMHAEEFGRRERILERIRELFAAAQGTADAGKLKDLTEQIEALQGELSNGE